MKLVITELSISFSTRYISQLSGINRNYYLHLVLSLKCLALHLYTRSLELLLSGTFAYTNLQLSPLLATLQMSNAHVLAITTTELSNPVMEK